MLKFNPGMLQTDKEVKAQFVVRENEFRAVCEIVRGSTSSLSCRHALVVGSRGQGKTMLLSRVAAEVRMDRELSSHAIVVQFMEENQEIDNLADFWMETLFHLARELATKSESLSNELIEAHVSLSTRWRDQEFEKLARSAVLEASDRIGRRLVLVIENMHSLFSKVDEDFGWGLRTTLRSTPQITLVASATHRLEVFDDPQGPLFGLFRLINLSPLNTEECRRLWVLANTTESTRHELRPLEILTGGNPRLIVIVATFADHRSVQKLMEELVALVDDHSEYFRYQLEILPKRERRVFIALIDLWRPASATEIAARARLDVRVVSTMLNRLIGRGVAMIVAGDSSRNRLYAASERLYSIYYKLRRGKNESFVVESLIHFMVSFYDMGEVTMMSEQLYIDGLESSSIQSGIEKALSNRARSEDDLHLKYEKIAQASERINDVKQVETRRFLVEELAKARQHNAWQDLLGVTDRFVSDGFLDKGTAENRARNWETITRLKSDAYLNLNMNDEVISLGEEADRRVNETSNVAILLGISHIKTNQVLAYFNHGDYASASRECAKIIQRFSVFDERYFDPQVVLAYIFQAQAEEAMGHFSTCITLFDKLLEKYGESDSLQLEQNLAVALYRRSVLLGRSRTDLQRAIRSFDEYIERYKRSKNVWISDHVIVSQMKQAINHGTLGSFEKEITYFDSVIHSVHERDSSRHQPRLLMALVYKGRRLAELGRSDEALDCCDEASRLVDGNQNITLEAKKRGIDWYANCTRALALMKLGQAEASLNMMKKAYDAFESTRSTDLEEIMRLAVELIAAGIREKDLIAVLQSNEGRAQTIQPLIVSLLRRVELRVNSPREVLEVADDLEQSIRHRLSHGLQPGYALRPSQT